MNNNRPVEPSAGISLGDIYYIIFRHKWKIIVLSLAGFVVAAGIHHFQPPPYQSQAELLIKYVPEATQPALTGGNQNVVVPGAGEDDVINAEIQILTSMDLAEEVVTNLGASNILYRAGGGNNPAEAAAVVRNNLKAVPYGSIIIITFQHPNPLIVQPVLEELINDYFQKQTEIHSVSGQYDDALSREQSTLSVQLAETEQQLADLKNKADIISLDDTRKDLADQISQIEGNILNAQADLSGSEAATKQVVANQPSKLEATNAPPAVPQDQIDAYNDVCADLDALHKKEQGYLVQGFTSGNVLLLEVDAQIADAEKAKENFEKKYPQIVDLAAVSPDLGGSSAASGEDVRTQIQQMAALQSKIKTWDTQLNQLQMQATNINNLAPGIEQLENTKAIQQANLQSLSGGIEQFHINQALDIGKAPNIKWVQSPSPPFRDWKQNHKQVEMMAMGGILVGLAWALLIEMFLDRSVRRPIEIESKLKLPLFLSIPDVSRNGHARLLKANEKRQLQLQDAEEHDSRDPDGDAPLDRNGGLEVVSLEKNSALQSFYDALRDRLIVYFEVKSLTHNPKLVAVTGASQGAGVSTIAAGLAASLSETGEGNVLLVDMNLEHGAAQQFYKGKAGCGVDVALKNETKDDAMVQENLYVVNGNSNNNELPHALPKRFAALVPKLKASEFDYIIFDMPPVGQTSITSRLARFMDMTLLVVESEKTDRELVLQANNWLVGAGATVSVVLNKTHKYVPERLHQDFLGGR